MSGPIVHDDYWHIIRKSERIRSIVEGTPVPTLCGQAIPAGGVTVHGEGGPGDRPRERCPQCHFVRERCQLAGAVGVLFRLLNPEPEAVRTAIEEALRAAQTTVDGLQQIERTTGNIWLTRIRTGRTADEGTSSAGDVDQRVVGQS